MRRPILNLFVENRADQFVLPDIGIKMAQQESQSLPSADSLIQTLLCTHSIHKKQNITKKPLNEFFRLPQQGWIHRFVLQFLQSLARRLLAIYQQGNSRDR